ERVVPPRAPLRRGRPVRPACDVRAAPLPRGLCEPGSGEQGGAVLLLPATDPGTGPSRGGAGKSVPLRAGRPREPATCARGGKTDAALAVVRRGGQVCGGAGRRSRRGRSAATALVKRDQRPPLHPSTLEPKTPQKASARRRNWMIPWLSTYVRHHSA